jgi:hypothetical protein
MGRAKQALLVAGALGVASCAGENLFSLPGTSTQGAPDVEITAPTEGFTLPLGDSIRVTAQVTAPVGGAAIVFRGTYPGGTAAFAQETGDMNGVQAATVDNFLQAAPGQVTGSPFIVVEVTGLDGKVGVDSVRVTITN